MQPLILFKYFQVFLFLFSSIAMAQPEVIALYPDGKIPLSKACNTKEVIDTTKEGRVGRIKNVTRPEIFFWKSQKPGARRTALLLLPGGGYSFVSYDNEGRRMAERLQSEGFDIFVLKYRLPNSECQTEKTWAPLTDAMAALDYVKKRGYDNVGLMGFSAGGHLGASLITLFDKNPHYPAVSPPDFACLVYPVINLKEYKHTGSRKNLLGADTTEAMMKQFSLEQQVSQATPPTLLIHSIDDQSVPYQNSELFFQSLLKHKVHAEIHLFPFGGHGFGLGKSVRPEAPEWIPLAVDFFERFSKPTK
jgi:acetyl esterase/lipase